MNPRLAFVVLGSLYFFVLLVSYFLGFLYPFFTPYGWLLIPVIANFFVGYLVKEVDTAIKIIIACLSLNIGIVFGGLSVSTGYDAFLSIPLLASYYTLHIVLGVAVSLIGTAVREYRNDVVAVSVRLVKKIRRIIEKRSSKV
jgi:hypothetical protein